MVGVPVIAAGKFDDQNRVKIRDKVIDDTTIDSDVTLCIQERNDIKESEPKVQKPKMIFIKSQTKAKEIEEKPEMIKPPDVKTVDKTIPLISEKGVSEQKIETTETYSFLERTAA